MINHVEKYIGTISHGSKSDSGNRYKLNIAAIPSSPNRDLKTYITLGLSKHDLNYKSRFEILFVCSLKYDENQIFPFLRWLAETIIENKKILLRGQVIYLPRSIVDSTKMDALYVSAPFYSGLNLNQDKATKPQTVQIVRQGEVTPYWFKVNPLYFIFDTQLTDCRHSRVGGNPFLKFRNCFSNRGFFRLYDGLPPEREWRNLMTYCI